MESLINNKGKPITQAISFLKAQEDFSLSQIESRTIDLIVSHLVLSNLLTTIVMKITRKLDTNYYDLSQIFNNYNDILNNLVKILKHNQINNLNKSQLLIKHNSSKFRYSNFKQSKGLIINLVRKLKGLTLL